MAKKTTKEEYIEKLNVKNPKLELIGDYINNHTKTPHRCIIHNIIWDISPNHALQGQGCKECALEGQRNKRRKSEEQYIDELSIKNPTIKLKGKYINTNTPVEHYCEVHDLIFDIRPSDALIGKGCKMCKSDKLRKKLLKSENQYIEELKVKNPNLKLLGRYIGDEIPVSHCCEKHNVVWDISPHNALQGRGCYMCRSEKIRDIFLKPVEEYIEELLIKNPDLKLIGQYINRKTPVEHYCKKHKICFDISPECALRGYGCHKCASEKLRESHLKSEEQYVIDLKDIHPNIMLIGEYAGSDMNTLHKCMVCGYEWSLRPSNLLSGCGCPKCNESKGEKQITLWLEQNKIINIPQKRFSDCCDVKPLPFDFYIPELNICIEYQGEQHYSPINFGGISDKEAYNNFTTTQRHDEIKRNYCTNNNIELICIPYWENINEYLNKHLLI